MMGWELREVNPLPNGQGSPLNKLNVPKEILNKQSVPVADEEHAFASPLMVPNNYFQCLDGDVRTLHDVFLRGLEKSEGRACLGWRPKPGAPYQWLSYQQVMDRVHQFGSGLIHLGDARTAPDQFVGLYSQNRVEWKVAEQACNSFSMVVVPLYDTLGAEAIEHVVSLCQLPILVVDTNAKAKNLLTDVKRSIERRPQGTDTFPVKLLVVMDPPSDEVVKLAGDEGVKLRSFEQVMEAGKADLRSFVPPKAEDLHTICFTSGTTGLPKGAMLTHKNLVANITAVYAVGKDNFLKLSNKDVHMSYLPLAHVFERVVSNIMYYHGGSVGFFQGDIKLLLDDVGTLRPTVFPMVPRLINRIYGKIWAGANASKFKKFILTKATNSKLKQLEKGILAKSAFWDFIAFRRPRKLFGGRVRICMTGAAPVSTEVLNFMRVCLGVDFTEGYGQTECTACICLTLPGDFMSGSIGSPAPCNIVKLVDVPDMKYYAAAGKGEVCVKGTNVFRGYYKDEEKTKEAVDKDGWLHTGDIGMWLESGALKIIDRKKHIFKLAQGEYVAPEKIEQILSLSVPVAQVFVYGESLRSTLVAIVVPDAETLDGWCARKRLKAAGSGFDKLCASDDVVAHILQDLTTVGKQKGLKSFELPKKIHVSSELFSVENDLLTPTFKSRRPQIFARYKDDIGRLYRSDARPSAVSNVRQCSDAV